VSKKHIAVFGPTGYIGTKVVHGLYNLGYKLSLFSRNTRRLSYLQDDCSLLNAVEARVCIVEQFLEEEYYDQIVENLKGVDIVYYFIHSLSIKKGEFTTVDNELAALVAKTAMAAGVKQIIYLGGLGIEKPEAPLSKHLKSRHDTAEYLRKHHQCVTEFRAGVIVGAGSASFEIIRNLGLKLPFLPQLPGVEGKCQPIFVDDVISYLFHAIENEKYYNQIIEIGSKDIFTYSQMLQEFARIVKHKKLKVIPLPLVNKLLTPEVIAWFASRMTPLPYVLIEPLIEGMHSYAIVGEYGVEKIDKECGIKPKNFEEGVKIAMRRLETGTMDSVWPTPYELSVLNAKRTRQFLHFTSKEVEGMLYEECSQIISADEMDAIFETVKDIGGSRGYFSPYWLWQIRGLIDKIVGGPGLAKFKRHSSLLRVGDRIDFWVVTFYKNKENEKVLRLKANMVTPGNAWLQFSLKKSKNNPNEAVFDLSAFFEPFGIWGYIYWYSLYFIHKFIFKDMVKNSLQEARKRGK
jgi:uncharacterized protein YbjT (DUF2867 family)